MKRSIVIILMIMVCLSICSFEAMKGDWQKPQVENPIDVMSDSPASASGDLSVSGASLSGISLGTKTYNRTVNGIYVKLVSQEAVIDQGKSKFTITARVPVQGGWLGALMKVEIKEDDSWEDILGDDVVYQHIHSISLTDINRGYVEFKSGDIFEQIPNDNVLDIPGQYMEIYPYVDVSWGVGFPFVVHDGKNDGDFNDDRLILLIREDDYFDNYPGNDTLATSTDQGKQSVSVINLICRDWDYHKLGTGECKEEVEIYIDFYNAAANLDLYLYNSSGTLLKKSYYSNVDVETITWIFDPGETYHVLVASRNSTDYSFYDLHVNRDTVVEKPTVTTRAYWNVTYTSAMSGGIVTSDGCGTVTARGVCWSTSPGPDIYDPHTSDGSGTGTYSSTITDLNPGTYYYIRAYAINSEGPGYGDEFSFRTPCRTATVETVGTDNVTASSANLKGKFNPKGCSAQGYFEWGKTTAYGNTTPKKDLGAGTNNIYYSRPVTGLESNTTYHFRAVIKSSGSPVYGSDMTFNTSCASPTAVTKSAYAITLNSAKIRGKGNPNGCAARSYFEWGPTTSYGNNTAEKDLGAGTSEISFEEQLSGLEANKTYHYRAVVKSDGGISKGSDFSFETNPIPTLNAPLLNLPSNGAPGQPTSLSLKWHDTNSTPQEKEYQIRIKLAGGSYKYYTASQNATAYPVSGLLYSRTYYWNVQAVGDGVNTQDSGWGNSGSDWSFATKCASPTVRTDDALDVTSTSAKLAGLGNPMGCQAYVYFEWGLTPAYGNQTPKEDFGSGNASIYFASIITGLQSNKTYHYRAVIKSDGGTVYGDDKTFATGAEITIPTVSTDSVSAITPTSAVCGGNVTSDGGTEVTARGVCWSTSANPTTADFKTADGTGTGAFTSHITGLNPGTDYHVRAYATNSKGTAYGSDRTFTSGTEITIPTVSTGSVSAITPTSAVCGGNVTSDGGAAVTARGVCWSTSTNPTTSGSKTIDGNGTGSFTSYITGLSAGAPYYARAYATNSKGTSYGSERMFTTGTEITVPTVSTASVSSITMNSAVCGGNVISDGGAEVTARGVCWSRSPNPTTSDSKTTDGSGTGSFTSYIAGLSAGTPYYARAFATNSKGTSYGSERMFTTGTEITVPTVFTGSVSSITMNSAVCGGNVISDGGAGVSARGVCWSRSPNPTTSDSKTTDGSGTGSFTSYITGLSAGTVYYVRAYAENSQGISYGSDREFKTDSSTAPTPGSILIISPNGGETLQAQTPYKITWTTTGTVGNVKIEFSKNGGSSWTTITSSTANDGTYLWTVPDVVSSKCLVRISEVPDGTPSDTSDAFFSIPEVTPPKLSLDRTRLFFGATTSGKVTSSQTLLIENSGGGILDWWISDNAAWLHCTPSLGAGSGVVTISVNPSAVTEGTYTGVVTVTAHGVANSPQTVEVTLKKFQDSKSKVPFGFFSTPVDGATVRSSIPVTGWVLDDVEVVKVKIYRGEAGPQVYIGDAVFVEGARPDVEQAYPGYPKNYKAGWGYMMLTNFLPNGGNGAFKIHAVAIDAEGHQVTLGSKRITCDNANAVKPFGAIDTPTQGGTASGSRFINWGWVLTPQPNHMSTDGSGIAVYVDGVKIGHPVYNIYRADIAGLFPGYINSNGAVGYFYLDTTAYANGVHTIQWTAKDSAGNSDGIGSRYFTFQNTNTGKSRTQSAQGGAAVFNAGSPGITVEGPRPVRLKKGYSNIEPQTVYPDENGIITIEIKELERLEIHLTLKNASFMYYSGYMAVGRRLKPLPTGTTLDAERGVFYWQPGPGFLGEYEFIFVTANSAGEHVKNKIRVKIKPRF